MFIYLDLFVVEMYFALQLIKQRKDIKLNLLNTHVALVFAQCLNLATRTSFQSAEEGAGRNNSLTKP